VLRHRLDLWDADWRRRRALQHARRADHRAAAEPSFVGVGEVEIVGATMPATVRMFFGICGIIADGVNVRGTVGDGSVSNAPRATGDPTARCQPPADARPAGPTARLSRSRIAEAVPTLSASMPTRCPR